jgi:hypothetical protein
MHGRTVGVIGTGAIGAIVGRERPRRRSRASRRPLSPAVAHRQPPRCGRCRPDGGRSCPPAHEVLAIGLARSGRPGIDFPRPPLGKRRRANVARQRHASHQNIEIGRLGKIVWVDPRRRPRIARREPHAASRACRESRTRMPGDAAAVRARPDRAMPPAIAALRTRRRSAEPSTESAESMRRHRNDGGLDAAERPRCDADDTRAREGRQFARRHRVRFTASSLRACRQVAGAAPNWRLKARLKPSSDPYPTSAATAATLASPSPKACAARCSLQAAR